MESNGNRVMDPLERQEAIAKAARKVAKGVDGLPDKAAKVTAIQSALDYVKAGR